MRSLQPAGKFAFLLALVAAAALLADEKKSQDFKSPQVRAAKAQFNSRVADIQTEANAKIAVARKQYIVELQKAKEDATRRADLDDAVRIRDELAAMQKELPAQTAPLTPWKAREALAAALAGTSWKLAGNPDLTLMADGTTSYQPESVQGRWAPIGNRAVVITFENGWTDLWLFDDNLTSAKGTHAKLGGGFELTRAR